MNIWDILLVALIALAPFFALRRMYRTRKTGGCSCGASGCSGNCAACGKGCHNAGRRE